MKHAATELGNGGLNQPHALPITLKALGLDCMWDVDEPIARYFGYVHRVGVRAFGRTELCCDVANDLGFLGLALADAAGPWVSWVSSSTEDLKNPNGFFFLGRV
jgi:hypothetical protein